MQRYLLDTNIFLFMIAEPDRLTSDVTAIVEDYDSALYLSAESVRELVILYRGGKIKSERWRSATDLVKSIAFDYRFSILPVDTEVMKTYASLEINEKEDHNDPSDHVIISHAMTVGMPLISSDRKFLFYRDQGLDLVFNG